MPELTEMSKHIMFEETKEGLNLEIVDQDGRSMFADGSKEPYDRTRLLIQKLPPAWRRRCGWRSSDTPRQASCRRAATMVRSICRPTGPTRCGKSCRGGAAAAHFFMVAGKADTQPLFPDDPSFSANRRVTITLMREDPPLPPNFETVMVHGHITVLVGLKMPVEVAVRRRCAVL